MSTGRWFRFYDSVVDDPKVQRLPDPAFRAWVNLMCIASKNEGRFSTDPKDISFALRITESKARDLLQILQSAGLIERFETGWEPHNWGTRQYDSDSSAERMRRHRSKKVTVDVTSHVQNSDAADSDSDSEQNREDQKEVSSPPAEAVATKVDPPEPIPKPKVQRRTQIPDDCPSKTLQGRAVQFWGIKQRMDLIGRLDDQVAQFRDHHLKLGSTMADWDAAWRTWYRKALEFTRSNRNGRKESTHEQGHRIALELIAELAESDAATDHRQGHRARAALPQISDDRRRTEVVAEDLLRRSGQ